MKNKNLLMILTLSLILFSIVNVQAIENDVKFLNTEVRFYHEYNTNLTISQQCRVVGQVCGANYTCYISVLSPSREVILNNQTMLVDGAYRNYTLNNTLTRPNGIYEATIDCDNTTYYGTDIFNYQITPDGSQPMDVSQVIILLIAMTVLILISTYSGYMAFKVRDTTISLSFLAMAILLIVFALGFMLNVIELSFGTFTTIISTYSTVYVLFMILLTVGGMGLIVYLVVVALTYYKNMRGMTDKFSAS